MRAAGLLSKRLLSRGLGRLCVMGGGCLGGGWVAGNRRPAVADADPNLPCWLYHTITAPSARCRAKVEVAEAWEARAVELLERQGGELALPAWQRAEPSMLASMLPA